MTHSFPTRPSSDGNACLAKVAKKGCADNGLQYREILLLSCYQRPPLDPALLPPSQRLSPARCPPRRPKEKEQCLVGTAPDFPIGRAHALTPLTNAPLVSHHRLGKKKQKHK